MEHTQKLMASFVGAIFVPVFEFLYGEGEVVMYTMTALFFFLVMDWISGVRASKKDKSYGSSYGIDGLFRSFFLLLLPAGGHLLDMIFGTPGVVFGLLAAGLLYHIIQSMTANAIRAGWGQWFPDWILTKLTEWVRSEIEAKFARAEERKMKKEGEA
ncbi:phage holin family protein [Lysinibacillus sp. NPDC056959]|uniref:phage holin family protein n=1 Tax=Lysinibacillus sp. NPDC056959 TaxID=3345981 RepID=UPI0036401418